MLLHTAERLKVDFSGFCTLQKGNLDAKTPIYLLYIGGDATKFIWVKIDGKKLVKVNYLVGPGEPGGVQG